VPQVSDLERHLQSCEGSTALWWVLESKSEKMQLMYSCICQMISLHRSMVLLGVARANTLGWCKSRLLLLQHRCLRPSWGLKTRRYAQCLLSLPTCRVSTRSTSSISSMSTPQYNRMSVVAGLPASKFTNDAAFELR
jgi:hypothetical protein